MRQFLFALILTTLWYSSLFAQKIGIDVDQKLGEAGELIVQQQIGVYDSPDLTAYIDRVGQRLVAELGMQPFDYTFKIADTEISNAFALPAGKTYVTRGLLAMVNSEDDLATVMAHEIVHAHRRHAIDQLSSGGFRDFLMVPGQIVGLVSQPLGNLLTAPVELTDALLGAGHSRKNEKEADKLGVLLAGLAGYQPASLIDLLNHLAKEGEYLSGEREKAGLLDDHPVTEKRIKYLGKKVDEIEVTTRDPEGDYLSMIDGLLFGQNPAEGIFREHQFYQPDLNLYVAFPKRWTTFNKPVVVGAIEPGENAAIAITIVARQDTSLQLLADELISQLDNDMKRMITLNEPIDFDGHKGYLITAADRTGEEPAYLHILWLHFEGLVYRLVGFGLERHQQELTNAASSIRKLTDEERAGVMTSNVLVVEARQNETIAALSKRTGNVLTDEYTAIMNGLGLGGALSEGQRVKVVVDTPYLR